jgi:hypothetical protein
MTTAMTTLRGNILTFPDKARAQLLSLVNSMHSIMQPTEASTKSPTPCFFDCDETSIECQWLTNPGMRYRIEYIEEIGDDDWTECKTIDDIPSATTPSSLGLQRYKLVGLKPKDTYSVRIIAIDREGNELEPSEILTVDTQTSMWPLLDKVSLLSSFNTPVLFVAKLPKKRKQGRDFWCWGLSTICGPGTTAE